MCPLRSRFAGGATAIAIFLASCGGNGPSSGQSSAEPGIQKPATSLPEASSNLTVSGAIHGTISDSRLVGCERRQAGSVSTFYSGIYFKIDPQWYELELIAITKLGPYSRINPGYNGTGSYAANAFLRAMDLHPGGMVSTGPAWSKPTNQTATVTVTSEERWVVLGSMSADQPPTKSAQMQLWPVVPGTMGPAPGTTPEPSNIVALRGSWSCK
jgi:hypothetical protein